VGKKLLFMHGEDFDENGDNKVNKKVRPFLDKGKSSLWCWLTSLLRELLLEL